MTFFFEDLKFFPFAHRGGSDYAPENSFEAFNAAVGLGYKLLETDLRTTKDGYVLAFHDPSLDRVTDASGLVSEKNYSDIKKIKIFGKYKIPLFSDLLEAFPECFFSVDIKSDSTVMPVVDLVKKTNCLNRVCMGSFSQKRINIIKNNLTDRCLTSMGPLDIINAKFSSYFNYRVKIDSIFASLPVKKYNLDLLNKRNINYLKSINIKVIAWTINQEKEIRRLIDLGVDGIMTDEIVLLKSILKEKDLW